MFFITAPFLLVYCFPPEPRLILVGVPLESWVMDRYQDSTRTVAGLEPWNPEHRASRWTLPPPPYQVSDLSVLTCSVAGVPGLVCFVHAITRSSKLQHAPVMHITGCRDLNSGLLGRIQAAPLSRGELKLHPVRGLLLAPVSDAPIPTVDTKG